MSRTSHKSSIGEHKSNVSSNQRKKFLQLWVFGKLSTDSFSHHCVLSHKHFTFPSESDSNLLHLFGANIVSGDDETGRVLLDQPFNTLEVTCFPSCPVFPDHFELW